MFSFTVPVLGQDLKEWLPVLHDLLAEQHLGGTTGEGVQWFDGTVTER